jgi:protein-tyrosine phosphatase
MAEAILKSKQIPGMKVRSAGVYAMDGSQASENTKKVLDENDLMHDHQSSVLSPALVDWATYIFTMTGSHKSAVISMFPYAREKVFTIKEFAENNQTTDIMDPFGRSVDVYRDTYRELESTINQLLDKLRED